MLIEIFEALVGGSAAFFALKVADKIIVDRAAGAVEERVIKPALDYVKNSKFWDSLDMLVADHAGRNVVFAAKALLFEFGKDDGVEDALEYVTKNFSDIKHDMKQNRNSTISDFMTLED